METLKAIAVRKSTRKFKNIPMNAQTLKTIIKAGQAAPVACGRHGDIDIRAITEKAQPDRIDDISADYIGVSGSHPIYGAPVFILVSAFRAPDIPETNPYLNVGCVIENMALAATDLEIGNVILALPVRALLKENNFLKTLNIDERYTPICALALGYSY